MARIFPSDIKLSDFREPGEERIFNILRQFSSNCWVWYEITLGFRDYKPDFLLIDPARGVVILEVKDWGKSTILKVSEREFRLKSHGKNIMKQKNPDRKCRIYLEQVKELLSLDELLVDKYDRLLFPIDYFTVFPNLTEEAFKELGLKKYINPNHVILKKETNSRSVFTNQVYVRLPVLSQPLTPDMMTAIRRCLREEVTITSPVAGIGLLPGIASDGQIELADELTPDIFALDIEQEDIAKSLGEGPRIMRGIAGTGKTLILLMRARLLASNAEVQGRKLKILILCWNISLANYMRQTFDHINIPLKDGENVTITHFSDFARKLINHHEEVPNFPVSSDKNFESKITQYLKGLRIRHHEKFDVIFIDEAQDFHDEWLKFLFHKMHKVREPKQKNFVVAADDAQRIYKSRNFSWDSLGIPAPGRSKILRKIYRNSARVWGFAAFLLKDIAEYYNKNPDLEFAPKRGVDPKLIECECVNDQIEQSVQEIKTLGKHYSWRNVLVIYRSKKLPDGFELMDTLTRRLIEEKIPYEWITESPNTKNTFQWMENSVKISTAHSAKGLDAPKVIVLSAESFDPELQNENDEIKLLYVALTRAREELTIYYSGSGGLVPELQRCKRMYERTRPRLIELENKAKEKQ